VVRGPEQGTALESPVLHPINRLPCQVGGGIRSIATAQRLLEAGAQRIIIRSRLILGGEIDHTFAEQLAATVSSRCIVCALDSRQGKVSVGGWRAQTPLTALTVLQALDMWFDSFLCTNIDTEGLMQGIPLDPVRELRQATNKRLMAAGGISRQTEIDELHQISVDAVVGMAIYKGMIEIGLPGPN